MRFRRRERRVLLLGAGIALASLVTAERSIRSEATTQIGISVAIRRHDFSRLVRFGTEELKPQRRLLFKEASAYLTSGLPYHGDDRDGKHRRRREAIGAILETLTREDVMLLEGAEQLPGLKPRARRLLLLNGRPDRLGGPHSLVCPEPASWAISGLESEEWDFAVSANKRLRVVRSAGCEGRLWELETRDVRAVPVDAQPAGEGADSVPAEAGRCYLARITEPDLELVVALRILIFKPGGPVQLLWRVLRSGARARRGRRPPRPRTCSCPGRRRSPRPA